MGIDRGTLSRIDRKLLAGLDSDEDWQMVRVPASDALWSAWKRYCSGIGLSMGRALSILIQHELEAVIGADSDVDLASGIESQLRSREEAVDDYERRLRDRERAIQKREHLLAIGNSFTGQSQTSKVGRNDRCPCGSGIKYKRCHGRPD